VGDGAATTASRACTRRHWRVLEVGDGGERADGPRKGRGSGSGSWAGRGPCGEKRERARGKPGRAEREGKGERRRKFRPGKVEKVFHICEFDFGDRTVEI